jgi:hypothetical protein
MHKRELHALGCPFSKGSPGAAVKLLPYDYDVMGSSPGNSLLHNGCVHKSQSGRTLLRTLCKRELRAWAALQFDW